MPPGRVGTTRRESELAYNGLHAERGIWEMVLHAGGAHFGARPTRRGDISFISCVSSFTNFRVYLYMYIYDDICK